MKNDKFQCPFCNSVLINNEIKRNCPKCLHEEFIYREFTEEDFKECIKKFDEYFAKHYNNLKSK